MQGIEQGPRNLPTSHQARIKMLCGELMSKMMKRRAFRLRHMQELAVKPQLKTSFAVDLLESAKRIDLVFETQGYLKFYAYDCQVFFLIRSRV